MLCIVRNLLTLCPQRNPNSPYHHTRWCAPSNKFDPTDSFLCSYTHISRRSRSPFPYSCNFLTLIMLIRRSCKLLRLEWHRSIQPFLSALCKAVLWKILTNYLVWKLLQFFSSFILLNYNWNNLYSCKLTLKKGKVHPPVQALKLCTGRTAHKGSRGIALLFLDHGTRKG
jgi:hypothetical protein